MLVKHNENQTHLSLRSKEELMLEKLLRRFLAEEVIPMLQDAL